MFLGYQSEDIIVSDPGTFLCVLGNIVIDENGLPVQEHKYVFSPEVVQRKVRYGCINILQKQQNLLEL